MLVISLLLLLNPEASPNRAQSCNPAVVNYIVRDERGRVLSEADLKTIADQLPKTIGDTTVNTGQVSFTNDMKTYYWPESVDWLKGTKRPALELANAATCTLHLTEVTLTYHGKKMRLVFNVDIAREQDDRRPVIDSLRFQPGTFALNLRGWSHDSHKVIPSWRWKRVRVRA